MVTAIDTETESGVRCMSAAAFAKVLERPDVSQETLAELLGTSKKNRPTNSL